MISIKKSALLCALISLMSLNMASMQDDSKKRSTASVEESTVAHFNSLTEQLKQLNAQLDNPATPASEKQGLRTTIAALYSAHTDSFAAVCREGAENS